MENLFPGSANPSAAVNQSIPYINQAVMEEELEEGPPSILDIQMAIQSMNNNISPGIDNIPAELYKS